jgi:hypothetical protein
MEEVTEVAEEVLPPREPISVQMTPGRRRKAEESLPSGKNHHSNN